MFTISFCQYLGNNNILTEFIKVARVQKLGWKVLILKYDLGRSLRKEMWCNMADTKKIDYIFKKMKNACNMR